MQILRFVLALMCFASLLVISSCLETDDYGADQLLVAANLELDPTVEVDLSEADIADAGLLEDEYYKDQERQKVDEMLEKQETAKDDEIHPRAIEAENIGAESELFN